MCFTARIRNESKRLLSGRNASDSDSCDGMLRSLGAVSYLHSSHCCLCERECL